MEPDPQPLNTAAQTAGDPLSIALLPALLHKLNNATQLLTGLNGILALGDSDEILVERASDLASTAQTIDDLGWLCAVLSSASGAQMLLERREPRGLTIVVEVLSDARRRLGHGFETPAEPLPALAPHALDGWQVPWAVGALLLAASDGAATSFTFERRGAHVSLTGSGGPVEPVADLVRERLPAASLEAGTSTFELRMPASWFGEPGK